MSGHSRVRPTFLDGRGTQRPYGHAALLGLKTLGSRGMILSFHKCLC